LKNSQKILQKSIKNPQKNRKVISFRKNVKIYVDIGMKKGGIGNLKKKSIMCLTRENGVH
jgi:hypothetical protein